MTQYKQQNQYHSHCQPDLLATAFHYQPIQQTNQIKLGKETGKNTSMKCFNEVGLSPAKMKSGSPLPKKYLLQ